MAVSSQVETIAKRLISNSKYASLYFGYFEAATDFLSANKGCLDDDAEQMLLMLRIGMPRLSALCLCRLWDKPGRDRHSLPALMAVPAFAKIAGERDQTFIRVCRKFGGSKLISELTGFRNTDLAHNLPLRAKGEGLTTEHLREILHSTRPFIDRIGKILQMPEIPHAEAYQLSKRNAEGFWDLVSSAVRLASVTSGFSPTQE